MQTLSKLIAASCLLLSMSASARDSIQSYSIADALNSEAAKSLLGTDIQFYFGDQKHGEIQKRLGEFRSNQKTNAFNKTDKAACEWAFLSTMVSLRNRAKQEGANAVVNIRSNYRNNITSSAETFQCGSGALIAGVALVGEMVTLK